jgi:hypothetical protein
MEKISGPVLIRFEPEQNRILTQPNKILFYV